MSYRILSNVERERQWLVVLGIPPATPMEKIS